MINILFILVMSLSFFLGFVFGDLGHDDEWHWSDKDRKKN